MIEHTKGPWLRDGKTVYVLNEHGFNRFCAQVQDAHTPAEELEANARRIVACVNACEGVSTDVLEYNARFGGVLRLERQRDALLAALERCVAAMQGDAMYFNTRACAEHAIAAVKGGA